MSDTLVGASPVAAPLTTAEALDPAWLTHALAPVTGGARISKVDVVETLRTMATKIRFTAAWDGGEGAFCLKAFLDVDAESRGGGATTIIESDFYTEIASQLSVRVPTCVATVVDRPGQQGVILMRDLIVEGARFCTALEPFSADQAAQSLEQLARLHDKAGVLRTSPWISRRIGDFVRNNYVPAPKLQELLDGPRGEGLTSETRDAARLIEGLKALAARDETGPQTLVHGDCHAGNIFQTAEGPGLIDWQLLQRGGWALDVAYHIAAVLPVEVAEVEEYALLDHYLDAARRFGCDPAMFQDAVTQYRASAVYGYYLWCITRRVDPAITNVFVNRLGSAVTRHESYRLLGLPGVGGRA